MKRILCAFLVCACGAAAAAPVAGADAPPRGGRVGWARLITESSSWTQHSDNDLLLARFIREETSLNIDPTCYPVDPAHLDELCAYPLIFTNNLADVHNSKHLANLREYLQRGGFIYIDRSVMPQYSPEQETFYAQHVDLFTRLFPGTEIRELGADHEINRCYFYFTPSLVATRVASMRRTPGHNGVYGVFHHSRMIALLSLANFQCGWNNPPIRRELGIKMIVNIYVYAMTRSASPEASHP